MQYTKNNTIMSTHKMVSLGVLSAISIVLVFLIRFPIIPIAPYLEYDPGDIPIFIGTFLFGPLAGLLLTIVASVVQGLTVSANSGILGVMMHIFSTGICALVAGVIYHKNKNIKTAVLGLFLGLICQVIVMVIMNLLFMPSFLGTDIEYVKSLIVPAIIPFNVIKTTVNCGFTLALYKKISIAVKSKV